MFDLIFISAFFPAEFAQQAGQKTAFRSLLWLAERYRVHLIAFCSECDSEEQLHKLHELCMQVQIIKVTRFTRLRGLLLNPLAPLPVAARTDADVRRKIREWSRKHQFTRAHFEWSQSAQYVDELIHVPERTLYIYDVLAQWAERSALGKRKWRWSLETYRARHWESKIYSQLTQIYVPSAKDRNLLDENVRQRTKVLPLHFDVYNSVAQGAYHEKLRILFWGALARSENSVAAQWLCSVIAPRLRSAKIPFVIVIAGSSPPPVIEAMRAVDIEVTGFIADPVDQFSRAHLAVLPLFQGAGVKVKVLECLAAGLPVLTTEIGREGIEADESDGLITLPPDPDKFVSVLMQLERNRNQLAQLSTAALAWASRQNRDSRSILVDGIGG